MNTTFKPMLASSTNLDAVRYPILASPKLDGIRASVVGGKLLSRTLKEIPSRHIFNKFSHPEFEGLDGELIVGDPTSPTCYRDTVSMVMADNKVFDFTYHVFDLWSHSELPFVARKQKLVSLVASLRNPYISVVQHECIEHRTQLDEYEAYAVSVGHEGVMLNSMYSAYKFGRATTRGGELLKVKRFVDSEAEIIGIEEEMFNGNEAEKNELGRTKRSTAKAGLVGKGTMGALIVRDLKTKVEFNIGTGFTAADRAASWPLGTIVKYKSFPVGVKDKPRHPVFLGLRPTGA